MDRTAVLVVLSKIGLPAQTVIQGQSLTDLPCIVDIGADVLVAFVLDCGSAHRPGRNTANEKVRHTEAGLLAGEGSSPDCVVIGFGIASPRGMLPADSTM